MAFVKIRRENNRDRIKKDKSLQKARVGCVRETRSAVGRRKSRWNKLECWARDKFAGPSKSLKGVCYFILRRKPNIRNGKYNKSSTGLGCGQV